MTTLSWQRQTIDRMVQVAKDHELIDALGIGGSLSAGIHSPTSDVDFFLFTQEPRLEELIIAMPDICNQLGRVAYQFTSRPGWAGWGLAFHWCLFLDLTVCDFWPNTPSSFTPHPHRKKTTVVLDKTGEFSAILKGIVDLNPTYDETEQFNEAADFFVHTAQKVVNSIQRGQIWSALHFLNELRNLLLRVIRLNRGGLPWPERPFKSLEEDLGPSISRQLERTIPVYDSESVSDALAYMVERFQIEAETFSFDREPNQYSTSRESLNESLGLLLESAASRPGN